MKIYKAFSLAEALITLLILCIIAIATAPIITKKARKSPENVLWVADTQVKTAVTPSGQKDIRLGDDSGRQKQGIVVVGTLYFKDKNNKIIGWIAEDGSTSFAQGNEFDFNAMSQKQEKLLEMVQTLMGLLQKERENSSRQITSEPSAKRSTGFGRGGQRNTMIKATDSDRHPQSNSLNASDLQNMDEAQLQQQLNSLIEMLSTQNR